MAYMLKKEDFPIFVNLLMKSYDVIAPQVNGKLVVFSEVKSFDDITLEKNSYYPPKRYFLPPEEDLLRYSRKKSILGGEKDTLETVENGKKKVILGMRMCDVSAVSKMDKFFREGINDPYYEERRENIFIIAMKCRSEENDNCFCSSFDIKDPEYDLFLERTEDGFIVDVGSKKGNSLIDKKIFKASVREAKKDLPDCSLKLKTSAVNRHSKNWDRYSAKCLSCSACNVVCPTCSCFDIKDYPDLDLKSGTRKRIWDYCQSADYTKVAGNHIFRQGRNERFKHRLMCKFSYMMRTIEEITCTGCGRCVTVCPTDVCNIPDILSDINEQGN